MLCGFMHNYARMKNICKKTSKTSAGHNLIGGEGEEGVDSILPNTQKMH
jgi:hypothetical protein